MPSFPIRGEPLKMSKGHNLFIAELLALVSTELPNRAHLSTSYQWNESGWRFLNKSKLTKITVGEKVLNLLPLDSPHINVNKTCIFCQENGGDKWRTIRCGHSFHAKCCDPYISNYRAYCPLCKCT